MTYTANHQFAAQAAAAPDRLQRANTIRDAVAGFVIILGVLLPWNVYFGITIAGTVGWLIGLLILVTLISLTALVLSHLGPFSIRLASIDLTALNRLRLTMNIPYLVVAIGFVVFDVVQSVRMG